MEGEVSSYAARLGRKMGVREQRAGAGGGKLTATVRGEFPGTWKV